MAEGRCRAGGRTGVLRALGLAARHRLSSAGLIAALFALMVQIALGAIVPAPDPGAAVASAEVLCHTGGPNDDGSGSVPPIHSSDCLVCPLCAALHAPSPVLGSGPVVPVPIQAGFRLAVVYAPVAAPSRADYPPLQARAPPLT
jgi:hypothetical protein